MTVVSSLQKYIVMGYLEIAFHSWRLKMKGAIKIIEKKSGKLWIFEYRF